MHVPDRIDMDQEADAGDHEEHQNRQLIDLVGDMDAESSGTDPWEDVDDKGSVFGGGGKKLSKDRARKQEPSPHRRAPDQPRNELVFQPVAVQPVPEEPKQRKKDDNNDQFMSHHAGSTTSVY